MGGNIAYDLDMQIPELKARAINFTLMNLLHDENRTFSFDE